MRAEVLGGGHVYMDSPGLGVFLRHGMRAWAEMCVGKSATHGACTIGSGSGRGSAQIMAGDRGELKMVLAELILGRRMEGRS